MNILFLSRAYPPVTGGIETQNHEIAQAIGAITTTRIIANRRGKAFLPLFLPYAILKALILIRNYDVVLLGDGVLGIAGFVLKLLTRKPVACIVHGLDLTYPNWLYQKLWVNVFLPGMDRLIAVGNETIRQGCRRGIPAKKFVFIPNGVAVRETLPRHSRSELENFLGRGIQGAVLLTLGRLVKRKGVAWFIENVLRNLEEPVTYIVAGDGPEAAGIRETIRRHHLEDRILVTGKVSDSGKELLYSTADLFVQPNIEVPGDVEGFGLVVLEAAMYGLVVIASNIEGLRDAIQDGQNGFLLPSGDAVAYAEKISALLANPLQIKDLGRGARNYVTRNCGWPLVARKYLDCLEDMRKSPQ